MRAFCLAILVFAASPAFAGNLKDLDAKNGFRDAKFGAKLETFKDMVSVEKGDGLEFFKRTSDEMTIGKAQISEIYYGFSGDQFYCVRIRTGDYTNSRALLEALQASYGPGRQDNEYIEEYQWFGSSVFMTFEQNSATDEASVSIISIPIMEARRKAASEAASKAKDDL